MWFPVLLYQLSSRSVLIAIKNTTLFCPDFISVQFTAWVQRVSLYVPSPWKCVLFILPVKAITSFLSLSSASAGSEMWRGTFDTSTPSVLPQKSLLNKFFSDCICSQPVYLPIARRPGETPLLSEQRERQKNMCALRERDWEGKVVSDLVTSTQKWGRQAAEIYISWRLTNGLPPLLFHYHSALLCGPEACQTLQEPRWAFTVKMQTAACTIPELVIFYGFLPSQSVVFTCVCVSVWNIWKRWHIEGLMQSKTIGHVTF